MDQILEEQGHNLDQSQRQLEATLRGDIGGSKNHSKISDEVIEDGVDDEIEEPRVLMQKQMKNNQSQLIQMLRAKDPDEVANKDENKENDHKAAKVVAKNLKHQRTKSAASAQSSDRNQLNFENTDIVSQYTLQSIDQCQDPRFLFLLLKNFARGKHSGIIEQTINKISEQFEAKKTMIEELQSKNDELVKKNAELNDDLKVAKDTIKELRQEKYAN